MRATFIPTRDYGLADPVNAQLVMSYMDRLDEDPSFCPVITVDEAGQPNAPRDARHLLTAAYWLGWRLYPAQIADPLGESVSEVKEPVATR